MKPYVKIAAGLTREGGCAIGAVCVGVLSAVTAWQKPTLTVSCTGRGSYQRTRLDKYGFPRGYLTRNKRVHGFQTGDLVRAEVPTGKKVGTHGGRVAVRASGSFNIQTAGGVVQGVAHRHCRLIQRSDGYGYGYGYARIALTKGDAGAGRAAHGALSLPSLKAEVSRAI
ncbi:hypothetical protein QU487_10875 [Crenobacter sp. SG2305]|uniref:hypothetical protein n=1 Tax=Crenobacter oryzisoli TaxID=3056844 RepID=UPI0025AB5D25|nr:hypothetical protein [Crenobacter sp. SG2305]MDN0083253.1 hypothetical protein [Crenobacter sp. SG2305]